MASCARQRSATRARSASAGRRALSRSIVARSLPATIARRSGESAASRSQGRGASRISSSAVERDGRSKQAPATSRRVAAPRPPLARRRTRRRGTRSASAPTPRSAAAASRSARPRPAGGAGAATAAADDCGAGSASERSDAIRQPSRCCSMPSSSVSSTPDGNSMLKIARSRVPAGPGVWSCQTAPAAGPQRTAISSSIAASSRLASGEPAARRSRQAAGPRSA